MTLGELYGSTKKETHNYSLPSRHIFSLFAFSRFQVCNLLYILFHALVDGKDNVQLLAIKSAIAQILVYLLHGEWNILKEIKAQDVWQPPEAAHHYYLVDNSEWL